MNRRFLSIISITLVTVTHISCAMRHPDKARVDAHEAIREANRVGITPQTSTELDSAEDMFKEGTQSQQGKKHDTAQDQFKKAEELAYMARASKIYEESLKSQSIDPGTINAASLSDTKPSKLAQVGNDHRLSDEQINVLQEALTLQTVYFDYDQFTITEAAQKTLTHNAKYFQHFHDIPILIEGHCDERGSNEYNLALGERRALSVKKFLVTLGISADRIRTISYGEEQPAVIGHGEHAWSQNRRAEFKTTVRVSRK